MNRGRIRVVVKILLALGFCLLVLGPCSYGFHEGFGGPAPPMWEAMRMRTIAYVMAGSGIILALSSAIALTLIDRNRHDK